jgi:hypothetical protein
MGVSSGAIRAGRAFVELFTNDSKLVQGLQLAEARVRKFAGVMARAGAAVAASAGTFSAPLGAALKGAVENGAEISQLAKNLGTTTEQLTAFGYAASTVGVPFSKLVGYLDGLPEKLSALADGGGASADLLRRLGINARNLIGLDLETQMATLADAVKRVASPIDRARVAVELFGDGGRIGQDIAKGEEFAVLWLFWDEKGDPWYISPYWTRIRTADTERIRDAA